MSNQRSVHLIGIGGAGLSAIARLLLESGYRVSGSDRELSPLARRLQEAGVVVHLGHRAANVAGADLVIRSSAIPDDNVEVKAAQALGIPVLKRSDFLGHWMADHQGIAVAGTHGKTTTTAMIAWVLTALGLDPSFIIGGVPHNLGVNAHAGSGVAFVVEADEYDRMFLGLKPHVAVVTNVEYDHPDCYPALEEYYQAFKSFAGCLAPGGWLVGCVDDPGARRLMEEAASLDVQRATYAIDAPQAQFRAVDLVASPAGYRFTLNFQAAPVASVALQVPGLHNVLNSLAALAVSQSLGLSLTAASQALGEFQGTARRFELRGEVAGVVVIDDYAHHPTKIRATLAAARQRYPGRRLWAVWQPHTYTRTQVLFQEFAGAFRDADVVVVTDVYASREAGLAGTISAQEVVQAMHHSQAFFVPELAQVTAFLLDRLQPGDVMVVMSAGDADQISTQVLEGIKGREK